MKRLFISVLFVLTVNFIFAETNEERLQSNQQKVEQFLNKGNYIKYTDEYNSINYYPKSSILYIHTNDSSIICHFLSNNNSDIFAVERIKNTYSYVFLIDLDEFSNLEISLIKTESNP